MKWHTIKVDGDLNPGLLLGATIKQEKRNRFLSKSIKLAKDLRAAFKNMNNYVVAICALLIVLFIYTGLNKIMDFPSFKTQLGRSPFIGEMRSFLASSIPVGEMLISLLLIIKRFRLLGLYLSFALMALFTGYVWLMLNYASDLPCSCGGVLAQMSWHDHLYFNAGFTLLTMFGIILQTRLKNTNQ